MDFKKVQYLGFVFFLGEDLPCPLLL